MSKMKWCCLLGVFALLLSGALFLNGTESQAKRMMSKPKFLKEGKVYKYDIDGDSKKEKVEIKTTGDFDEYVVMTKIRVDGKNYATVKEKGSFAHQVVLFDLYAKKKGMNFLIYGTADSDCVGKVQVFRAGAKKMTKIAQMKSGAKGLLEYGRMNGKISQGKEEGSFYIYPDTPFYLNLFGCYYTKVKCQISGNKIKWVKQKNYTYYYKHVFQLKRDMDAYEKASLTSEKSTLTSGTKLTVVKIQPMRRDSQGKRWSFVQVKTSAGKTVWVYDEPIDDYDSNNGYFQGEIPAWG